MTKDPIISPSNHSQIENGYSLSLKFFMNKNLSKSFEILKPQYTCSFENLKSGVIDQSLFIKILNLYLTQAGLVLEKGTGFTVNKQDKQQILNELNDQTILSNLIEIYQDINHIPSEILYNLYLIQYIGLDLNAVQTRLTKLYSKLDFSRNDKFIRKILELYILKVLPECDLIDDAKTIIKENPLLEDKDTYFRKLARLQHEKELEQENQKRLEYQKTRDQKKKEANNKLEKDLKYKSLKQIKQAHQQEDALSNVEANDEDPIISKLTYHFNLTRKYLLNNSPMLLLTLITLLIVTRYLKVKKVNIGQAIKETLKMAFKVSYL